MIAFEQGLAQLFAPASDLHFAKSQHPPAFESLGQILFEYFLALDLAFGLPSEQQGQHHLHQVLYFRKREPIPNAMLM